MGTKEQSSSTKASDNRSQHKQPEIQMDQNEYEMLMAADTVQRYMDGHQPPLTPAHVLALQRKVGNTAVQRLIEHQTTKQLEGVAGSDLDPTGVGAGVYPVGQQVPDVQRQGGDGAGGGPSSPSPGTSGGSGEGPGTDPEGPVELPAEGPPMKFTLAGSAMSISLEGGEVSVGYTANHDMISKTVGPLMFPLATGVGIVMSASLKGGLSAGGKISANMVEEVGEPPMAPETLKETATIEGSLEFKIGIAGELFFGLGAGVQAANIAAGIAGSLEFSDAYKPRIRGTATRYSYPEGDGQSAWDEWSGEVTMEQELRSELVAQLKAVTRWHLFTESGDWFVVDIGNWPIYEVYSVGTTTYGLPDGDVTTSLDEGVKFLGVPMDVVDSGHGKPPWESEGVSGSGPTDPNAGQGGAPADERSGGSGGYGPATTEEISEGDDIMSSDESGAGGMGGGSQDEGLLGRGGQGGEGGASQEELGGRI